MTKHVFIKFTDFIPCLLKTNLRSLAGKLNKLNILFLDLLVQLVLFLYTIIYVGIIIYKRSIN